MRVAILALLTAVHVQACVTLGPGALEAWVASSHLVTKLLAAAGCLVAAHALAPRDPARRFWAALGACYVLLAALEPPLTGAVALGSPTGATAVTAVLLTAANAFSAAAAVLLARQLHRRLTPAWAGAYLLAAGLAAALVLHGLRQELAIALAGGNGSESALTAASGALSYLADGLAFFLLVPVIREAAALGGSVSARPWWAYVASAACWMVFSSLERVHSPGGASAFVPAEALRTAATLLTGLAGLYQHDLAPRRRGEAAPRGTSAPG